MKTTNEVKTTESLAAVFLAREKARQFRDHRAAVGAKDYEQMQLLREEAVTVLAIIDNWARDWEGA